MKSKLPMFFAVQGGIAALLVFAVSRLHFGQLPDPNDKGDMGKLGPDEIRRNLKSASEGLEYHRMKGELTESQEAALMAKRADELLPMLDTSNVGAGKEWELGQIYVAARKWDLALAAYEIAVKNAPDENRRIQDTLQLARCQAHVGKVLEAVTTARSVFNAHPRDKAPILHAVLLEIFPAAKHKGFDDQILQLTRDAVQQSLQTIVDDRYGGKLYLEVRPTLIRKAYGEMIKILRENGQREKIAPLLEEYKQVMDQLSRVDSLAPEAKAARGQT